MALYTNLDFVIVVSNLEIFLLIILNTFLLVSLVSSHIMEMFRFYENKTSKSILYAKLYKFRSGEIYKCFVLSLIHFQINIFIKNV